MINNNQRTFKLIHIAIMLGTILVALGIAYATLDQKLVFATSIAQKAATDSTSNKESVIMLREDIKHIKYAVDRIETKMDND